MNDITTRRQALDAAIAAERDTLGIRIRRHGDDYTLEELWYDAGCLLPYASAGHALVDEVDFGGYEPRDYILAPAAEGPCFDRLAPVKAFLDGETDGVDAYSVDPRA